MTELLLTIPGTPVAKKRPRFVRRGKFVGTYNPQQTEEGRWLWDASQQIGPDFNIITDVPIEIDMKFYMPIPAAASKKKRDSMVLAAHTKKPDIDNLQKFALDCLNGILFHDDSQVYRIIASKIYGTLPRTEVKIRW